MHNLPLIAPKHFSQFTPEEFQSHVKAMYELRQKGSKPKKPSFAEGITLSRTKKGALSVRVSKTKRAFNYATEQEVTALAKGYGFPMSEVWNLLKKKKFIISRTADEAKAIKKDIDEIPW